MRIGAERTLIVYDPATKMESFVRTVEFAGNSDSFGFIVPTPSMPTFRELSESVHQDFADAMIPKPIYKEKTITFVAAKLFAEDMTEQEYYSYMKYDGVAGAGPSASPGPTVFDKVDFGEYEVTVLKAKSPEELQLWAKKNGFTIREEVKEWVKPYVDESFYLSAFRFKRPSNKAQVMRSPKIEIKFKAEKPFYPYSEPDFADVPDYLRELSLMIVTPKPIKVRQGLEDWYVTLAQCQNLNDRAIEVLQKEGFAVSKEWVLNTYSEETFHRLGSDLFIEPDPEGKTWIAQPVEHVKVKYRALPGFQYALIIAGLALAGWYAVARSQEKQARIDAEKNGKTS
ncbi:MAG: DUF2330 domain-containing protein [Armatimonadetes bacterium]|nr:DUF2330 domain-containing protein [Armatimonadota bacterium]